MLIDLSEESRSGTFTIDVDKLKIADDGGAVWHGLLIARSRRSGKLRPI
ncbi:hypothetical protein [Sphingomonas montanisoli]|nr:hypothetical protein [Sphingomonas montanisoli]